MEYNNFKNKLGTWGEFLQPFIVSKHMDDIYAKLKADGANGVVICPDSKNTFRAFLECPFDSLQVVFILMDPYPWVKNGVKVADGIAMSCSNTDKLQPSLDLFYDGIEKDLYDGLNFQMVKNPDLAPIANQGVLFLNTSLTTRANQVGSHETLWKKFTEYTLTILNLSKKNTCFVFLGDIAKGYSRLIQETGGNRKLFAEHPARAAHMNRAWNTQGIFTEINNTIKKPIKWIEYVDDLPF